VTNVLEGDTVAQLAHVGWAIALVLTLVLFGMDAGWAMVIVLVFAFAKEAAETLGWAFWEPKQPLDSSVRDFEFWTIGVIAAGVLLLVNFI
jgi:hypothetical protein